MFRQDKESGNMRHFSTVVFSKLDLFSLLLADFSFLDYFCVSYM